MKKIIGLSLDREILEIIDNSRGLISRSAYVQKILNERLRRGT
ncbi:hypothetical protein BD31_I0911 [Candidatus Nitrosopumilus salaria BD31]|uniref:Ribbon-helix-helix protein CopG domain-containing protein n=1 Tax=Candidatus Nitrosopumilus salarius BD31 TaxID=859350 RepID=I3CZN0_9ARCH|nr:hypothetical protein BD31_I0911 [Candidatus Nitrosopumilus salaria BD31]